MASRLLAQALLAAALGLFFFELALAHGNFNLPQHPKTDHNFELPDNHAWQDWASRQPQIPKHWAPGPHGGFSGHCPPQQCQQHQVGECFVIGHCCQTTGPSSAGCCASNGAKCFAVPNKLHPACCAGSTCSNGVCSPS